MDRQTFLRTGLTPITYVEAVVDHQQCPIDLTDFTPESDIVELACGHIFCRECILTWLNTTSTCPYCRRELFIQPDSPCPSDDDTLVDDDESQQGDAGSDRWSGGSTAGTLVGASVGDEAELDVSDEEGSENYGEEDDGAPNGYTLRWLRRVNRYDYQLDDFVVPDRPGMVQCEMDAEHDGLEPVEPHDETSSGWDSEYDEDDEDEEILDLE